MKNAKDRYGAEEFCQMIPHERLEINANPEIHDTWILERQELLTTLDHAEREIEEQAERDRALDRYEKDCIHRQETGLDY